jgi:hypothetical protein
MWWVGEEKRSVQVVAASAIIPGCRIELLELTICADKTRRLHTERKTMIYNLDMPTRT